MAEHQAIICNDNYRANHMKDLANFKKAAFSVDMRQAWDHQIESNKIQAEVENLY